MLGGGRGRLEAAGVRRPGDQTERALPIPGVHRVDAQPELAGEVPAYGALAPRAGLPGQRGQQASRVPDGSPAPAIHAGQRVHLPAVTGADLHVERAQADLQRPPAPRRAREVAVGVDLDVTLPVRPALNPFDGVEPGSGQWQHVLEVVGEHVPDRPAGPVMVDVGDGVASGQQMAGELPVALGVGRRDHEIAAQEADRVLHASLLPSAGGVAEPDLDPVMLAEQLKHLHHTDSVPRDPVRGACGVVEHHQRRDHADVLEDLQQPLAYALRVLPGQGRGVPHVRMRERGDQAMHRGFRPTDHRQRLAEIDLHGPRPPLEFHETVVRQPVILPPALHVTLHHGIRAGEPRLLDQSVVHTLGGMPLLARHAPVGGQPRIH